MNDLSNQWLTSLIPSKAQLFGVVISFGVLILASSAFASPHDVQVIPDKLASEPIYSPYTGRSYPDQVLLGDSHFHTNLSFDTGLIGTRVTVHDGYRFARGEKVISNTG